VRSRRRVIRRHGKVSAIRDNGSHGFPGGVPIVCSRLFFILILTLLPFTFPPRGACGEPSVSRLAALENQWVTAVEAGGGGIWVGTAGGRIAFLRPGARNGSAYGPADGLPPGKVNSVAVLGGKVYVGTERGFGVFDGSSWTVIGSAEGKTLVNVFLRAEPDGKALWAGAVNLSGALLRLEGERWKFLGGRGKGLLNNIQAFAFLGDTAWLGSVSSGVLSMNGDRLRAYGRGEGLPPGTVYALEPFAGTVWAGTAGGAARYAEGK